VIAACSDCARCYEEEEEVWERTLLLLLTPWWPKHLLSAGSKTCC